MNNETSFKQHNKKRFIIVAGVKDLEWESVPFGVAGQYVGPWFVGSVYEASSSVFFSDGVPSGTSSSGCERGLFGLQANCSLCRPTKIGTRKNSSWEEEGINALCQLIGQWVTESLDRGIDSRKEIDLWLLQRHQVPFFWVFGMNRPRIELRSPGPLANTLTIRLMDQYIYMYIYIYK